MRAKSGGVAFASSARVVDGVIQVSVSAKRFICRVWARSEIAV